MDNPTSELTLRNQIGGIINEANAIRIVDQASANKASGYVAGMKAAIKAWKDYWADPKAKAAAAHKAIVAKENEVLNQVEPVVRALSARIATWLEAERARIAKENEERERAEWAARRKAEEADRILAGAKNFEEMAPAVEAVEKAVEAIPDKPAAATTEGIYFRDNWKWRVSNFEDIPRKYLVPDEKMLGEIARRDKDKASIPGIEFYNEKSAVAQRS